MLPEGDPQPILRRWLPHFLMLASIAASLVLLGWVVAPLFEPILLAAGLAMLTAPVLFEPVDGFLARRLPKLSETVRRRVAGVTATVLLGAALVAPAVVLVIGAVGSIEKFGELGLGVIMRHPDSLKDLRGIIAEQVDRLAAHYPKLPLAQWDIPSKVMSFLGEATDMSSTFLSFIASGTGAVAQLALAIIALAFFYVEGPRVARAALHYSPLRDEQVSALLATHRATVLRLLNDTVATAVVKGVVLGGIIWAVHRFLIDTPMPPLPFVPVALVAGVITLLPLVGVTIVWLPLAVGYWSTGEQLAGALLAVLCWGGNLALDRFRDRMSRRIDEGSSWRSFLLFIGLVGGLLSFGVKGLIIGPMSVVLVSTVCSAWLPLYGGGDDDEPPEPEGVLAP